MRSLAVLALAACAAPQKPDGRVTALEDKIASQQREIEDLRKQQTPPDNTVGKLEDKVAALETKIEQLDRVIAATAPQAPAPHYTQHPLPDPDKVYAVRTLDAATEGPANAKVTIVVWSDYACPYCEKIVPTLDDVRKKYGSDVRVVHQSFLVHQNTKAAALAACAANHQKKWREMSDLLWSEAFHNKQFDDASIDKIAESAKLDLKLYRSDIGGRCNQEIADEMAAAQKFQINAIPSTFVNGRFIQGAQPVESFAKIVDEELAKANAAIKKGVKQDRYYEQEIIGKGLTEVTP